MTWRHSARWRSPRWPAPGAPAIDAAAPATAVAARRCGSGSGEGAVHNLALDDDGGRPQRGQARGVFAGQRVPRKDDEVRVLPGGNGPEFFLQPERACAIRRVAEHRLTG